MLKNSLYSVRHERHFAEKFFTLFLCVRLQTAYSHYLSVRYLDISEVRILEISIKF